MVRKSPRVDEESTQKKYGRGVPITLKCPLCNHTDTKLGAPHLYKKRAQEIRSTGQRTDDIYACSRETGTYHTRKYEVRHEVCGHTWWSVHPGARRRWESNHREEQP